MTDYALGSSATDLRVLSYHFNTTSYQDFFYDLLFELSNLFYFEKVRRCIFKFCLAIVLLAYCFVIIVSGGIFLAVVLIPFLGNKLYKRFVSNCGSGEAPNNLLFCCRRRRRRDPYGNFLRKKISPRVELDFPSNLRVGETISFRVIFPISRHRTLQIVQNQPESRPSLQESVYLQEEYQLDRLSIDIVKVSGSALIGRITPIRELLPRSGPETNEDILLVKFLVQESGFYQINILYEEEHVEGSPFPTPFNATDLDPEKTICIRESPIVLSIAGEFLTMCIRPMDRYGNECNFGDVDTSQFHFQLLQMHETMDEKINVESVIFNFTREIKKVLSEISHFEETLEVQLEAEIFQAGIYQGILSYAGTVIQNGIFDIVTLSPDEHNILRTIMNNNPGSRFHEARLVSIGSEVQKKPRQVYVYVASKTLTIKEYYFGLIPIRISTFRILPATLLKIQIINNLSTVVISDRIQPKVTLEMDTTLSRVILSMFALFLKQRLGGSESFENKQKFFYEELKSGRDGHVRATITCIAIQRSAIVNTTLSETKNFTSKEWCKNFKIKFLGEEGSDDGGLRREWLSMLCKEIFENNSEGMFCSMGNSRLVHPNPNRDQSKWTLKHYELAGKLVAKCLFETAVGGFYKQMVNARFSRSFLGQIIGFTPHYKYLEQDDPELFMTKVKYMLENDVDDMDLNFTEEEYSTTGQLVKTIELIPNGKRIPINNENKEEYLNALAQYRLSIRVRREIESFLKGLSEIVNDGLLMNFDENELEILMCGKSTFNVDDLKIYHVESGEGGMYMKILPWYWICLTNMTDEERTRLLQFTTGSSLLPHGGFKELQPAFRITVYDSFGKLPIAHTCFNEICLSDHRTFEEFEKALKTAINEGSEGFALM